MRELPIVVALGGNAISPPGRRDSIQAQYQQTRRTAEHLVRLACRASGDAAEQRPLLVTHGNGPQVGNVLLRSDLAAHLAPRLPLDTCVADTQGGMGYMIQQCLDNAFLEAGVRRPTATVVTRTLVQRDDPAFSQPSKPIGGFHTRAQARRRIAADGWVMREDAGRGWRRVVASPEPKEILEEDVIRTLLAARMGAEALLVLTGVEHVALDFGRPSQRDLHQVSAAELAAHADQGQFAAGSMLPKVRAVLWFLEQGGRRAIITTQELAAKALAGDTGTQVTA